MTDTVDTIKPHPKELENAYAEVEARMDAAEAAGDLEAGRAAFLDMVRIAHDDLRISNLAMAAYLELVGSPDFGLALPDLMAMAKSKKVDGLRVRMVNRWARDGGWRLVGDRWQVKVNLPEGALRAWLDHRISTGGELTAEQARRHYCALERERRNEEDRQAMRRAGGMTE